VNDRVSRHETVLLGVVGTLSRSSEQKWKENRRIFDISASIAVRYLYVVHSMTAMPISAAAQGAYKTRAFDVPHNARGRTHDPVKSAVFYNVARLVIVVGFRR